LPVREIQSIKSNITSGGLGTMGFALPLRSAQNSERRKEQWSQSSVMEYTNDHTGAWHYMQSEVDVKIIILNNNFLGMVRQCSNSFMRRDIRS
jgi:acetolactate synthase-1/2/3 large subunit